MAEKYEGKKYNAYIHMQQHSLLMHFHSRVQQSTIWRYVLCMYAYACTCIYTPLCTTDVCCRCLILHVYSFILCVFVDVSCIRIMFCTQLAPFVVQISVPVTNRANVKIISQCNKYSIKFVTCSTRIKRFYLKKLFTW